MQVSVPSAASSIKVSIMFKELLAAASLGLVGCASNYAKITEVDTSTFFTNTDITSCIVETEGDVSDWKLSLISDNCKASLNTDKIND